MEKLYIKLFWGNILLRLIVVIVITGMNTPFTVNAQQYDAMNKYQVVIDEGNKQNITGYFSIANIWGEQLRPPNNLNRGIINLKEAMNKWTDIQTSMESYVYLNSDKIHDLPFVYISTDDVFEITRQETANLKEYFDNGGFMVIEDAQPLTDHSRGEASLKQMIRDVIPNARFAPIPDDHPLYSCFFDFPDGPPQGSEIGTVGNYTSKHIYYLEGVWYKGRLAVIYSNKGYILKWNDGSNNDPQLKMGINMIVYALIHEGGMTKPVYK